MPRRGPGRPRSFDPHPMRLSPSRARYQTGNGRSAPGPRGGGDLRIAKALQRPPRVPVGSETAAPTAAETVASGLAASSCDLAVEVGRESGKQLLVNGAAEGEPLETGGVLVWAPLTAAATALALTVGPGAETDLTSGYVAGTLEFLEQAQGSLRAL